MSLFQYLILGAILTLIGLSLLHSIMGEKLLIKPILEARGNRILESKLARMVLRFAWHITSVSWLMMAIVLYFIGFSPNSVASATLLVLGGGFLTFGIFDLIVSRGKHVGWTVLTLVGVFCLSAYGFAGSTS